MEIIKAKEIETQDDLVRELRALNFDITQATISRDIKELGLIKIMTDDKKYKYAAIIPFMVLRREAGKEEKVGSSVVRPSDLHLLAPHC